MSNKFQTAVKRCRPLIAAVSVIAVLLAGCAQKTPDISRSLRAAAENPPPPVAEKTETQQRVDAIKSGADAGITAEIGENRTVRFTGADFDAVRSVIDGIEVKYPYADIMNLPAALAKYDGLPEGREDLYEAVTGLLSDGVVSENELIEAVYVNNRKYREENRSNFMHTDPEEGYLKTICGIICDTVNRELQSYDFPQALYSELDYTLTNLCVFSTTTYFNNAFVNDEGHMVVSPVLIESMKTLVKNERTEAIIISHEVEHLFQKISTRTRETLGVERGWGFCLTFPDLEVNSLHFNWFLEAAAEKLAAKLYNSAPITYTSKIGYLDSLILVGLLRDEAAVDDIPRLTQQYSLDRVYETFGCDTAEKQLELLHMLYAINIIQEDPADFITVYERGLGREMTAEELSEMKIRLKGSICTTLSKYFYGNLSEKMAGESVELSDIFTLLSILEADMNLHLTYDDETRYPYFGNFPEAYCLIQGEFFERISGVLNIPVSDIQDSYNAYNAALSIPKNSMLDKEEREPYTVAFTWLTGEKNRFLTGHYASVMKKKTVTISQMNIFLPFS
jgi:hypothetical protein